MKSAGRREVYQGKINRRFNVRVREMKYRGFSCWPPEWAGKDRWLGGRGILREVKAISGTKLIRIDVEYEGKIFSGIIPSGEKLSAALYQTLRSNLGKSLLAIGDLEINISRY